MAFTYGDQQKFIEAFAYYSGMSQAVVAAWAIQEQPPGSPATPGGNNWLNIQYTDSGPNSTYFRIAGMKPWPAGKASVEWARQNIPQILDSAGHGVETEAAAIVNSGWASSHYGGLSKFIGVVNEAIAAGFSTHGKHPGNIGAPAPEGSPHAIVITHQQDPRDSSPKVTSTGKRMSETGQHFKGHTAALRAMLVRGVRF